MQSTPAFALRARAKRRKTFVHNWNCAQFDRARALSNGDAWTPLGGGHSSPREGVSSPRSAQPYGRWQGVCNTSCMSHHPDDPSTARPARFSVDRRDDAEPAPLDGEVASTPVTTDLEASLATRVDGTEAP